MFNMGFSFIDCLFFGFHWSIRLIHASIETSMELSGGVWFGIIIQIIIIIVILILAKDKGYSIIASILLCLAIPLLGAIIIVLWLPVKDIIDITRRNKVLENERIRRNEENIYVQKEHNKNNKKTTESYSDFLIVKKDDGITITLYNGKSTDVEIPSKIDNLPVISIGDDAFKGLIVRKIKNLIIPDTIKTIGNYAFRNNEIISVVIPNSVVNLADNAFDPDVIITRR